MSTANTSLPRIDIGFVGFVASSTFTPFTSTALSFPINSAIFAVSPFSVTAYTSTLLYFLNSTLSTSTALTVGTTGAGAGAGATLSAMLPSAFIVNVRSLYPSAFTTKSNLLSVKLFAFTDN